MIRTFLTLSLISVCYHFGIAQVRSQYPSSLLIDVVTDTAAQAPYDSSSRLKKLDSVKNKLTHRIDSLNSLRLPTESYTHLLDSLNRFPAKTEKEAQLQLALLQNKIKRPVSDLNKAIKKKESQITAKLDSVDRNLATGVSHNASNLQSQTIPNLNSTNTDVANQINGVTNSANISQDLNGVQKELSGLSALPQKELNQLNTQGELGTIEKELKAESRILILKPLPTPRKQKGIVNGNLRSKENRYRRGKRSSSN